MGLLPTLVDAPSQSESERHEMGRLLTSPQLLRLDAVELSGMMQAGSLTSSVLVESVLAQIGRFENGNTKLNAMLDMASLEVVMKRAVELDSERREGHIRGPLHGIPIIIKDCISTHPDLGMKTSMGSYALINSRPARSSSVIQRVSYSATSKKGTQNANESFSFSRRG
jgi:amidase